MNSTEVKFVWVDPKTEEFDFEGFIAAAKKAAEEHGLKIVCSMTLDGIKGYVDFCRKLNILDDELDTMIESNEIVIHE